jgi:hypothetical protein
MNRIIDAQIETGTRTSCTRTLQTRRATSATSGSSSRQPVRRDHRVQLSEEVAVCNLAPAQFMTNDGFSRALADVTAKLVRNLNLDHRSELLPHRARVWAT